MDIESIFEECVESETMSEKDCKVLNSLLVLKSPMDFTNEMASDYEINRIRDKMKQIDVRLPDQNSFRSLIFNLVPTKSLSKGFI